MGFATKLAHCAGFVGFVPSPLFGGVQRSGFAVFFGVIARDLRIPVAPCMKYSTLSLSLSLIISLYYTVPILGHRCSTPHCSGGNEILSNTSSLRNKLAN